MKRLILLNVALFFTVISQNNPSIDSDQYNSDFIDLKNEILNSEEYACLITDQQRIVDHKLDPLNFGLLHTFSACWADEGTSKNNPQDVMIKKYPEVFNHSLDRIIGKNNNKFAFNDLSRWSTTATDGGGLVQGDPTTLTWSFTPDGTSIFGYNGEPTSDSDLIAMLDDLYDTNSTGGSDLTQRAWFVFFEDIFDRWSELTGFSYIYEPNDDGSIWGTVLIDGDLFASIQPGVIGVRGDIRIAGHSIDGQSGSNVLAYNFFPNGGDMVIDTDNTNLFGDQADNSLSLRNTLSHEHGHGLGLGHSCPIEQTKLMEPFISSMFDGPQFDDILGANRGYGDNLEPNDNTSTATDLGTLMSGSSAMIENVSIDDNSDDDYYKFTTTVNAEIDVDLVPIGSTYLAGFQNSNGSCQAGTNFNPQNESNLTLELLNSAGSVIVTINNNGLGGTEQLINQDLPNGPNTYYLRVSGAQNKAQLYELTYEITEVNSCNDGIQNGNETDVDCGGPDCDPCPMCMDGIQNQGEMAIDCGGPCPACITGCMEVFANNYVANADIAGPCNYDCTTSTENTIDGTNVNSIIITKSTLLESATPGPVDVTTGIPIYYRANNSVELNQGFSVSSGSSLTIDTGDCAED